MSVIVYAQGVTTPPKPPNPFSGLTMTYTGPDGQVWDLYAENVAAMDNGVNGTHLPAFADFVTALLTDGQRYRGGRTMPRTIGWVIRVAERTSGDFLALDRRLWKSFHPKKLGVWEIKTPDQFASTRRLKVRLQSDGGHSWGEDPSLWGRDEYPVTMVADQPFWLGEPITQSWGKAAAVPFWGGLAGDGNLWISEGSTADSATMTNPGDEDAFAVWTAAAEGANVDVVVTVDGGKLGLPTVPNGTALRVYSDPESPSAWTGTMVEVEDPVTGDLVKVFEPDVDVSGLIDPWDLPPIPAGEDVPIGFAMTGLGTVSATIEPKHWRAW